MSACADVRVLLGVYVLGLIEPADRVRLEAHLTGCPRCRQELAGLAGLPGLLRRVAAEAPQAVLSPAASRDAAGEESSAASADALLAEAARRRRAGRVRWRLLVGAAAMVVALTLAVIDVRLAGGWPFTGPGQARPSAAATITARVPLTHVSARLALAPREWGTALTVRLEGVPPGTRCRLVAVGTKGRLEAGRRTALPEHDRLNRDHPHRSGRRRDHH